MGERERHRRLSPEMRMKIEKKEERLFLPTTSSLGGGINSLILSVFL